EVTLVSTTDAFEPLSLRGVSLEHKVRRLNRAAAAAFYAPTASFFMDERAFRHIVTHPKPLSALARAYSSGWILIKPFPLKLRLLLLAASLFRL
ncbi:MAG: hypothetical protein AB1742_04315, partial [bacterium]